MTEDKNIRWYNRDVNLQTVVNIAWWGTIVETAFAAFVAYMGQVAWWFVPVVPVFLIGSMTAVIVTALLIQKRRTREHRTSMRVKVNLFGWRKTWLWDYRESA